MKLRFLKLMLLLFILPLQMLAAELGEAGKLLATLPGVYPRESTCQSGVGGSGNYTFYFCWQVAR